MRWAAGKQALALLQRVQDAGVADRFQLRDVARMDATMYLAVLNAMVEGGLIERVNERPGVWYYRLTEAGKATAVAKKAPKIPWWDWE